jgi:hypothetical protein
MALSTCSPRTANNARNIVLLQIFQNMLASKSNEYIRFDLHRHLDETKTVFTISLCCNR